MGFCELGMLSERICCCSLRGSALTTVPASRSGLQFNKKPQVLQVRHPSAVYKMPSGPGHTYIGANRLKPKEQERLSEPITSEMAQTGQHVSIADSNATQTILFVIENKLHLL